MTQNLRSRRLQCRGIAGLPDPRQKLPEAATVRTVSQLAPACVSRSGPDTPRFARGIHRVQFNSARFGSRRLNAGWLVVVLAAVLAGCGGGSGGSNGGDTGVSPPVTPPVTPPPTTPPPATPPPATPPPETLRQRLRRRRHLRPIKRRSFQAPRRPPSRPASRTRFSRSPPIPTGRR